jgi:hypothetical protein
MDPTTHNQILDKSNVIKDSYTFSFFHRTIKNWNKLTENITNNTTTDAFKEGLSHGVLLKTFPLCHVATSKHRWFLEW